MNKSNDYSKETKNEVQKIDISYFKDLDNYKANSIKYLVDCGFSKNVIEFFLLIYTVSNN